MAPSLPQPTDPTASLFRRSALALFIATLLLHFAAALSGWNNPNLPGVEFRQAQTALSAHFIQSEGNFSLAYPTPVLGKPWSIPMEFPLYQWTVVGLSNLTGVALVPCARAVSLVCFYLTLPALVPLLRRLGANATQRWLALTLVIACPLHVFYGRAFLIETMALMFAVWFVAALVETVLQPRWTWWSIAAVAGAAAGAVKVTTFIVYLLPAVIFGAVVLLRNLRRHGLGTPTRRVLGWGLGAALPAALASWAWTRFADGVKSGHPQAEVLMSGTMTQFNFGYGYFDVRFDPATWREVAAITHAGVMPLPLIGALIVIGAIWAGRWRRAALAGLVLFVAAPAIFPLLYKVHDYYFVANATLLLLAGGGVLAGLAERRGGPAIAVLLAALIVAVQAATYLGGYHPVQALRGANGPALASTLHDLLEPDEVMVIVGDDWNSMLPYYAKRRALMIRKAYESDENLIRRAFANLADESVAVLVLMREQRDNTRVVALADELLGISPLHRIVEPEATLLLNRSVLAEMAPGMVEAGGEAAPVLSVGERFRDRLTTTAELPHRLKGIFRDVSPTPDQFYFQFGPATVPHGGGRVLNAHTDTRLWFTLPDGARRLELTCGLFDGAWQHPEVPTDGVEINLVQLHLDGAEHVLFSRLIDPVRAPADRGTLHIEVPLDLPAGSRVRLAATAGPAGNRNCDWFYLGPIRFRSGR